jgi:F-type H+-transporting ATPase subunit delta
MTALKESIVEPYANALMSIAQEHALTERFGEDAANLISLLESSEELRQFLANPLIEASSKKAVLSQIIGEQLHPYVKNFVMLLVDRRRISFLAAVCQQYRALLRALNQTVLAEVSSVRELTEAQQQTIREKVIAMTNARHVELATKLDPDLIGGVVIKVGSQIIDASLRGQLRRISLRLMAG